MSETTYPPTPILKWKEQPRNLGRWLCQKSFFGLLVIASALPWWGFKHLLTAYRLVLNQSEALKFSPVPLFIPLGSVSLYQLSRLMSEWIGLAQGSTQVIHRRPKFSLTPNLESITIGEERLSLKEIKKCALSVVAFWLIAYALSAWPLYSNGWVKHSLAFELLCASGATIAAALVGIVPTGVNFARSLTLRIDEEGITSRGLRGNRLVPWEQIAACKMVRCRDPFEAQTVLVLTLQDHEGKTLLLRSLYASDATLAQISQTMLRMLSVA